MFVGPAKRNDAMQCKAKWLAKLPNLALLIASWHLMVKWAHWWLSIMFGCGQTFAPKIIFWLLGLLFAFSVPYIHVDTDIFSSVSAITHIHLWDIRPAASPGSQVIVKNWLTSVLYTSVLVLTTNSLQIQLAIILWIHCYFDSVNKKIDNQ